MPIKIRVPTGDDVQQLPGLLSIDMELKDPSKRLDFSPENTIFAHQPPQANRYIGWLYASSQ
jgi:hypothetical protein